MRILKKYPNRRLYDTEQSEYVTLDDVRKMILGKDPVKVLDSKTGKDLTRSVLLQIIAEQEAEGHEPLLTNRVLEQVVRFYGDSMQSVLSRYLEQSIMTFLEQQELYQRRMREVLNANPLKLMQRLADQNINFLRSLLPGGAVRAEPANQGNISLAIGNPVRRTEDIDPSRVTTEFGARPNTRADGTFAAYARLRQAFVGNAVTPASVPPISYLADGERTSQLPRAASRSGMHRRAESPRQRAHEGRILVFKLGSGGPPASNEWRTERMWCGGRWSRRDPSALQAAFRVVTEMRTATGRWSDRLQSSTSQLRIVETRRYQHVIERQRRAPARIGRLRVSRPEPARCRRAANRTTVRSGDCSCRPSRRHAARP